jgi:outer membrane protein TolC
VNSWSLSIALATVACVAAAAPCRAGAAPQGPLQSPTPTAQASPNLVAGSARDLPIVSDARVKELLAQAQGLTQSSQTTPASAAAAARADAEVLPLRLEEAVQFALERNLDIAVERLNPEAFARSIDALRASYLPTVASTIGTSSAVNLPTNQLAGGSRVENDTATYNVGATQALPWGGGSVAAGWLNRKVDSTSTFNTFNPQYNSSLQLAFVQPLWRNLTTDATRTQLRVTRINRDISEIQLRATITTTLANVRNAYWDYVFAVESLDVAQRSLALAEKLLEDNKIRVEVGTMAPLDVVQAEAEAATRRQALAVSETSARTTELSLKRLIVSGTDDPRWKAHLSPVDRPAFAAEHVDIEGALRNALDKRTDLQEGRRNLQVNEMSLRLLRNQTLPGVDFVSSYGLQGIGGTQLIRDGGLGTPVTDSIPGGFGDALHGIRGRDFPTWNVALQISYPIGTSTADANYARARITVRQTEAQIKALELQVATEVTTTALLVESTLKQVDAATVARELAQRRLEAESSKFEVGMSTNFFVVQAQRDLADAQNAELRAQLEYRKSLVNLERVQETSLANAGINLITPASLTNSPRANAGVGTTNTTTGTGTGQQNP